MCLWVVRRELKLSACPTTIQIFIKTVTKLY
jgi:hypothetical protein